MLKNTNATKIIIATNNPHKMDKLSWIINGFFDEVVNVPEKINFEENGETFKGNAEIKALSVAKKYNCFAIATDGGVLIPALGTKWNQLLTRRFVGKYDATDFERIDVLLDLMKGKKGNQRKIIWREAIALAYKNRIIFSIEVNGDWGLLQNDYNPKQYKKGVWLCTLWSYPQFSGKNFFELNKKEKKYGERSWWILRKRTRNFLKNNILSIINGNYRSIDV